MNWRRNTIRFLSPIIRKLSDWYLSSERKSDFFGFNIVIPSGVFHPALFFSTKALANYLNQFDLSDKTVLELGSGSGALSVFAASKGAKISAIDINP